MTKHPATDVYCFWIIDPDNPSRELMLISDHIQLFTSCWLPAGVITGNIELQSRQFSHRSPDAQINSESQLGVDFPRDHPLLHSLPDSLSLKDAKEQEFLCLE